MPRLHKGKRVAESSDNLKLSTTARQAFDAHVTPALEAAVERLVPFLKRHDIDWGEAVDTVMRLAWRRGAYLLDPDDLEICHHWVMSAFVTACQREE